MSQSSYTKENIAKHYDDFSELYENWSGSTNGGYHYGIAKRMSDVLHNDIMVAHLSNYIIDSFDINGNDAPVIFDAGCGSGDVAQIIAKRYKKAQIYGMTLSLEQYEIAQKKHTMNKQISVVHGDFEKTDFTNEKFDIIFFVDSICHATDEDKFLALKESYRILKPGGKLIICDAFLQRDRLQWSKWFMFINQKVLDIWRVNMWGVESKIKERALSLGYVDYSAVNLTWRITPSVLHIILTKIPWAMWKSVQDKKYLKEFSYFLRLGIYAPLLGMHPIFRYQLVTMQKPQKN